MQKILAVCLNPTFQRTILISHLTENEVLRSSEYYYDVGGKGLNTARILTQLGCSAIHLTHAGGAYKDIYLEENKKQHIDIARVETESHIMTCKTIKNSAAHTTTENVE